MAPAIHALPALLLLLASPAWAAPPAPGEAPATPSPSSAATVPPPTGAAPVLKDDDNARLVEQAKAYFTSGNKHYAAGRYAEAIRHFQAGYALVPRPNFLVNLGQSYRKVGDLVRAKEAYLAYVRALPQDSPLRDQALQVLAEIEVQLQERRPAETRRIPPVTTAVPGPTPGPPRPTPPPEAGAGSRVLPWVAGGTGLALAGAGLVFQLRARQAGQRLSELTREGGVYDPALEDRGRRDQRIGVALLVSGGVAVATAAVIMWLDSDGQGRVSAERALTSKRRWRLAAGAPGAGLQLRF